MRLLVWTPAVFSRGKFKRDSKGFFFESKHVKEAMKTALVFYYVKREPKIERKVRSYLLSGGFEDKDAPQKVWEIVNSELGVDLEVFPERIYVKDSDVLESYVEIFDLKKWEDVGGFKTEVFKGEVEIDIPDKLYKILKPAGTSFCEALAKMEKSMLKEHPLAEQFYEPLLNELKSWDVPLRIGIWTESRFKGRLLYFWKLKDVRELLFKKFKTDIRPNRVLYIPREFQTAGWGELKK